MQVQHWGHLSWLRSIQDKISSFNVMFCWILVIILCIFVFIYLWFSSYFAYECIPFSHQTLQPEKPFKKTLNPSFVWLNIWDCVGLFLCGLETISGTNRFQHGFGAIVERRKILSRKTQSSGDPSCAHVYKINYVYLGIITCAVYSL